jgi:hypothetical protein
MTSRTKVIERTRRFVEQVEPRRVIGEDLRDVIGDSHSG